MPPVGAKVSAFSVMDDRTTASRQLPSYVHLADHSFHHASVSRRLDSESVGGGSAACVGDHATSNGTRSPARTVNSATVRSPRPVRSADVRTYSVSGPAVARMPVSTRRTQGTTDP